MFIKSTLQSAGMLGISAQAVAEWGAQHCASTRCLTVVQRVIASRNCSNASATCVICTQPLIQVYIEFILCL